MEARTPWTSEVFYVFFSFSLWSSAAHGNYEGIRLRLSGQPLSAGDTLCANIWYRDPYVSVTGNQISYSYSTKVTRDSIKTEYDL